MCKQRVGPGAVGAALLLAAGCSRSASLPAPPPEANHGRIVSLNRRPLPGGQVRISGCPDQVTATDGSFDTGCAAATYDLHAAFGSIGIVYQGLTRRDPLVTVPVEVSSDGWCIVTGTIAGRAEQRQAGYSITSTAAASNVTGLGAAPSGFFSSSVLWLDASPSATVHALEWTEDVNGPTAFTAHGSAWFPLAAGKNAAASPVLTPISTGTLTVPLESGTPTLWVEWRAGEISRLPTRWSGGAELAVPTPDIPGVSFTMVIARAEYGAFTSGYTSVWRRALPATATLEPMALPSTASFTEPAAEALVDLSTDLRFSPVPAAVYLVALESGVRSDPQYYVVTGAATARVPDFTWAGLPPLSSSGETYRTVSVSAMGPLASVDELAGGPLPIEPDWWAWQRPFAFWPPAVNGFATRERMTVRVR